MNALKNNLLKSKILLPLLSPFLSTLIIILSFLILYQILPSALPLFYSLPWGERQLAFKLQFLILPAIILLISLINATIIWHLHQQQIATKKILLVTIIATSLIITITAIKIMTIFI